MPMLVVIFSIIVVVAFIVTACLCFEFYAARNLALQMQEIVKHMNGVIAVMIEKYGVDMSTMPVTDDQIKTLNKVASELNISYKMPCNREEADKLIFQLTKKESV